MRYDNVDKPQDLEAIREEFEETELIPPIGVSSELSTLSYLR